MRTPGSGAGSRKRVYKEIVESGPRKLADLMQALLAFLGRNDMMAYLVMMAIRLVELHRVLKPTGSIYLHCDPTASHYLKMMHGCRVRRCAILERDHLEDGRTATATWEEISVLSDDVLLVYTKGHPYTWNQQYTPFPPDYIEATFKYRILMGEGGNQLPCGIPVRVRTSAFHTPQVTELPTSRIETAGPATPKDFANMTLKNDCIFLPVLRRAPAEDVLG